MILSFWTKVKASSGGLGFSHIFFFAKGLMLFEKTYTRNCEAISLALGSLCELARQKISKHKTRILFSPNVNVQTKLDICHRLGIEATIEFGRYLGLPLFHQGRNENAFNFVIEIAQPPLQLWSIICSVMLSQLKFVKLWIN